MADIVTKVVKTSTPTNLVISRDPANTFNCGWAIKSTNHNGGQNFAVRVVRIASDYTESWSDWCAINKSNNNISSMSKNGDFSIGTAATTKTVTFTLANAYSAFQFRVQGCRDDEYKQIQKPKGNPHDQHYYVQSDGKWKITADTSVHKNKTYYRRVNYTMSDWAESPIYYFDKPVVTGVSHTLTSPTSSTFSWDTDISYGKAFNKVEYQTCLATDWNSSDGKNAPWPSTKTESPYTSGSWSKTEQNLSSNTSYTRWVRVHALGPKNNFGDDSNWVYNYHTYAPPAKAIITSLSLKKSSSNSYEVTANFRSNSTFKNPVDPLDGLVVQYRVDTPATTITTTSSQVSVSASCPTSDSWTDYQTFDRSAVSARIPVTADLTDKAIFIRIKTIHDFTSNYTVSDPRVVKAIKTVLAKPTIGTVVSQSSTVYRVPVTKNTAVTHAFTLVWYRTKLQNKPLLLGVIPYNSSYTDVVIPPLASGDSQPTFGVQSAIGTYSPAQATSSTRPTYFSFLNDSYCPMSSDINWEGGAVPVPPTINATKKNASTIQVTWTTPWEDATQVELSWSNHDDAWESTDEPSTYLINNTHAANWNISGLSIDSWYVRARLVRTVGESTIYGTYSAVVGPIELASVPDTPSLFLNKSVAAPGDTVTCSWVYSVPSDGSEQAAATLYEGTRELASVTTATSIPFTIPKNWSPGSTHNLRIRVTSGYGLTSGYSPTVPLKIANAIGNVTITSSLENVQIITDYIYTAIESPSSSDNPHSMGYYEYDSETANYNLSDDTTVDPEKTYYSRSEVTKTDLSLTELPLTVSATGAGFDGTTTYIIERATDYTPAAPDESDAVSHAGETIAIATGVGERQVMIGDDLSKLYGTLNDGAEYVLYAIARDKYDQTAKSTPINFFVHWDHKAQMPSALIEPDSENLVTFITPQQPESGYVEGDVCDIYRLSAEKPELILAGADFGVKYVDPYPTLGQFGGHRIVYRTVNGDHIANVDGKSVKAWTDYTAEEDNDIQDYFAIVIDFDGYELRLPYNVSVSSNWTKDFTETKYLGGEVTGDWNSAVSKSVSLSTVIPVEVEPSKIELLNRLATYSGACHVRTPDGASYAANVEVKDDREEKWVPRLSKVSLTITRIISTDFDGMTEEQWLTMQPSQEIEYE